jgi:hypothetical protein
MGLAGPGGPKLLLVGMAMHRKNTRRMLAALRLLLSANQAGEGA